MSLEPHNGIWINRDRYDRVLSEHVLAQADALRAMPRVRIRQEVPMPDPLVSTSFGDPANEATVTINFKGLQAATQQQAISVAAWLRNIALEVEDETFRLKVDPDYTCRYCQPLNAE